MKSKNGFIWAFLRFCCVSPLNTTSDTEERSCTERLGRVSIVRELYSNMTVFLQFVGIVLEWFFKRIHVRNSSAFGVNASAPNGPAYSSTAIPTSERTIHTQWLLLIVWIDAKQLTACVSWIFKVFTQLCMCCGFRQMHGNNFVEFLERISMPYLSLESSR